MAKKSTKKKSKSAGKGVVVSVRNATDQHGKIVEVIATRGSRRATAKQRHPDMALREVPGQSDAFLMGLRDAIGRCVLEVSEI